MVAGKATALSMVLQRLKLQENLVSAKFCCEFAGEQHASPPDTTQPRSDVACICIPALSVFEA
jgi:hypothetical protein